MSEQDLPAGWCAARLEDIVDVHDGRRVPVNSTEREKRRGPYPYYGANGPAGTIDDFLFDGDYVLLAEDGGYFDDKTRGVAYIASGKFWVNNHAHVLAPRGGMDVRFLVHQLNSLDWMPHVTGTTRLKLTQGAMNRVPVTLPPLNEQRRIVAKLEDLLARNRRAKEALDAIPPLLETLRRSILAAAFRGDLTADWRAKHPDVEPADRLLARIRTERRKKWEEAELARLRAKGKAPTDDQWKDRYRTPEAFQDADLPLVPESWRWASLDELCWIVGGVTKGQRRAEGTRTRLVPYLRVANVQRGHLDLSEVKEIEATESEIADLRLLPGDILLNEGGDRDKLGRGWVWTGELPECIHQNHVFRARPVVRDLESEFISHYANTFGQTFFLDAGKQTTNLASVSMSRVRTLPVPVPPRDEQVAIGRRVSAAMQQLTRFFVARVLATERATALDIAVLAKAFRGELVAQDPNDEPADALLARLRAAEDASERPSGVRKKRNKKSAA